MTPLSKIAASPVTGATFARKGSVASAFLLILSILGGCKPTTTAAYPPPREGTWTVTTLNTYWYMDPQDTPGDRGNPPKIPEDKAVKTANLVELLIQANRGNTPHIIGFQEIGGEDELILLRNEIEAQTGIHMEPLFKKGRDTYTGQNVGALWNPGLGWKLVGQADRQRDLEREVSKHLTFTLEKEGKRLHIIIVHLRVPKDPEATLAHQNQMRAILKYSQRFLKEPDANLIVMGDFNEKEPVDSTGGDIGILLNNGLNDSSSYINGDKSTHQKFRRTLDRILISPAINENTQGLQISDVWITPHKFSPYEGTDHYPITLLLEE